LFKELGYCSSIFNLRFAGSLQILDQNAALISTITEYQNLGRHNEALQYQRSLHQNLMYLASVADNAQSQLPMT
jgi:hypothetical protein